MKSKLLTPILFFAIFLVASCSSTKITSSWTSPDANRESYSNILVIGLAGEKDRPIRENMEKAVASQLNTKGLRATSAFSLYGPSGMHNDMTDDEILETVRDRGFDSVLLITLLDKEKEQTYTPGTSYVEPYGGYYGGYRGRWMPYYRVMYQRVYTPGYYTTTTNYILQADLYSVTSSELLYSAQTSTFDPSNIQSFASDFSNAIIKDMEKQGILPKNK